MGFLDESGKKKKKTKLFKETIITSRYEREMIYVLEVQRNTNMLNVTGLHSDISR
jgi:hypothetical protein